MLDIRDLIYILALMAVVFNLFSLVCSNNYKKIFRFLTGAFLMIITIVIGYQLLILHSSEKFSFFMLIFFSIATSIVFLSIIFPSENYNYLTNNKLKTKKRKKKKKNCYDPTNID